MTTGTQEATTVVEYGVKYTWPDGHTEFDRCDNRADAERRYRTTNGRHADGEVPQTAVVVTREVTTTAWEVAR